MKLHVAVVLLGFAIGVRAGEAGAELKAFSAFGELTARQLSNLANGEVMTQANASMKFARGISMQACYFVAQPPEVVARLLQSSDPTKHPELETYQFHFFHSDAEAQFDSLKFPAQSDPFARLLRAMKTPDDLQLSEDEARNIGTSARDAESARRFWAKALADRWSAFTAGGIEQLPRYVQGKNRFSVADDFRTLLTEEPGIARHFKDLLRGSKQSDEQVNYWGVSKVDKLAAVNLGRIVARNLGDHWQVLDTNFYVSSGYLGSLTFYELWPTVIDAKHGTLVWQCDIVSAPGLAGGFGVKRKIASLMIASDTKATVRVLQQDAARAK